MRRNQIHRPAFLALVLAIAAAHGCTQTDVIEPDIGTQTIEMTASPAPALTTIDPPRSYPWATINIVQLSAVPVDPEAQANLGDSPLGMIPNVRDPSGVGGIVVDLIPNSEVSTVPLNNGTYQLVEMRILRFQLNTDATPPTVSDQGVCDANGDLVQLNQAFIQPGDTTDLSQVPSARFTVSGDASTLRVVFDGEKLAQALNDNLTCGHCKRNSTVACEANAQCEVFVCINRRCTGVFRECVRNSDCADTCVPGSLNPNTLDLLPVVSFQ